MDLHVYGLDGRLGLLGVIISRFIFARKQLKKLTIRDTTVMVKGYLQALCMFVQPIKLFLSILGCLSAVALI